MKFAAAGYAALLMGILAVASVVGGLLGPLLTRLLMYRSAWFALLLAAGGVLCLWGMLRQRTAAAICGYGGIILILIAGSMARTADEWRCLLRQDSLHLTENRDHGMSAALPFRAYLCAYHPGTATQSPQAIIEVRQGSDTAIHVLAANRPASIGDWQLTLTGTAHGDDALCLARRDRGWPVFVAGALLLLAGSVLHCWRRTA